MKTKNIEGKRFRFQRTKMHKHKEKGDKEKKHNLSNRLFSIMSLVICFMFLAGIGVVSATEWTPADFNGEKADYAHWLREGYGVYHIDDDPGLTERNGVVNDALLYLTFGPNELSTFATGKTVEQAYRDQMLAFADGSFAGDADRVLTSIAETYLYMRDEGIFNISEQQHVEEDLFLYWANYNAQEAYGHQFVPHALAAVTAYILDTTRTGVDYSSDVSRLCNYAKNNALDFGETWGPIENSAHYNCFVFISMMRISTYCNSGSFPESHKGNLNKAVEWILDTYPHNGFTLSFGETWDKDHVRQLFSFLIGASHVLNDGNPDNIKVARNAKWLANKIFSYGFNRDIGTLGSEWKEGVRGEPMWIWKYANDSLSAEKPDVDEHGSKAVYGMMGDSYSSSLPNNLKLDKVVHRDGWDDESFYLLLDMAPGSGKNKPYANSIVNFVYSDEAFSTGKTGDRYNTVWEKRNVVYPHNGDKYAATLQFINNFEKYSVSKTQEGSWDRYISFVKDNSYAVVFDFAPSQGTCYWHLVSDPGPIWNSDYVELNRGSYQLNVYYPNELSWYTISHSDSYETTTGNRPIWFVDRPSRELKLRKARTWATVLYPYRGEAPTVTAINPTQGGTDKYPDVVGVKLVHLNYTDWHGARKINGIFKYDAIITDSEIFWVKEDSNKWIISYAEGSIIQIPLTASPREVTLDGSPISDWDYESGILTITPSQTNGTLEVNLVVDLTPPPIPLNLIDTAEGQKVNLTWEASSDPESGISGYKLYRGTESGEEGFSTYSLPALYLTIFVVPISYVST